MQQAASLPSEGSKRLCCIGTASMAGLRSPQTTATRRPPHRLACSTSVAVQPARMPRMANRRLSSARVSTSASWMSSRLRLRWDGWAGVKGAKGLRVWQPRRPSQPHQRGRL